MPSPNGGSRRLIELLAIPLTLVAGTVALVAARARALARPLPPTPERQRPLTPSERLRLHRWERRMRRCLALSAIAYLALLVGWLARDQEPVTDPRWALGLLALVGGAAAAAQFSAHCPRCGYNLGFQTRLTLPASCERCGGAHR